jgi:NADH-quinone oxidoreductase subunit C
MPEEPKGPAPVSPPAGGEEPPAATSPVPSETIVQQPVAAPKPEAAAASKPEPAKAAVAAPGEKAAAPAVAKPAAAAAKPAPKPEGPKPEPWESELVTRLRHEYGSGIHEASTYLGQKYLVVDKAILHDILMRLRDDERFDYCVDITAVHYPKREEQFDILYILYSFPQNERVRVKAQIKDGDSLGTAVDIWETANWLEREVYDMFGITFEGHPDLKRILLPDGWKGHPLRKDYPILQQDQEWVKINLGIESGQ